MPFCWASITSDDVYIFEIGSKIFRWKGQDANQFEWLKSDELANSILRDEQSGRGEIQILEQGVDRWPQEITDKNVLPNPPKTFPKSTNTDDNIWAEGHLEPILWRISNASGNLEKTKIIQGLKIDKDKYLDTNDCFILDCYNKADGGQIYVWKGKKSNMAEKKCSMKTAIEFLETENYGKRTGIAVMAEGFETAFFKNHFQW